MIDRLVHHAEILALKGESHRLKDRNLARPATPAALASRATATGVGSRPALRVTFRPPLTREAVGSTLIGWGFDPVSASLADDQRAGRGTAAIWRETTAGEQTMTRSLILALQWSARSGKDL